MKKFLALTLSLGALFLEIMPWGAVLNFASPEGEITRKTYSYFSLVPYGYANFFPLMTGILTVLFLLVLVYSFFRKNKEKNAFFLNFSAAILSFLPLTGGIRQFSYVGLGIGILLSLSAVLLWQKDYLK